MSSFRFTAITTAFLFLGCFAETCEAGPLLDWLRGTRRTNAATRYNTFYRGPAANAHAMAQSGYSQMPGTCMTTCPKTRYQTVNRVVANYVPYTAFRTEWYRVPVTYYRPVTTSNPQSGCVTTCMKPCTYYQMQARRVPYTTYQTVYRTIQHKVPYTVYETSYGSSCSPCSSCTSCGVGGAATPAPAIQSYAAPPVQSYGLNPNTQYGVPANSVPQLNPGEIQPDTTLQRPASPVIEPQVDPTVNPEPQNKEENTTNSSHSSPNLNVPANPAPTVDDSNRTASLIRGNWNYSPVQAAGHVVKSDSSQNWQSGQKEVRNLAKPNAPAFRNSGWKSVK